MFFQVLKKAERERAETMRESISIIKEKTASDISTAFHQSVGSVLDYNTGRYSRLKGQPDLCHQLMIPLIILY